MHLSFTRYKLPVSVASHGDQSVEAHFIESLVSVFDRNEWVADLDILGALRSPNLHILRRQVECDHKDPKHLPFRLTSIDSWSEFLDQSDSAAIFRANKNWLARLAAVVLNVQRGQKTVLFAGEGDICWSCAQAACLDRYDVKLHSDRGIGVMPVFVC